MGWTKCLYYEDNMDQLLEHNMVKFVNKYANKDIMQMVEWGQCK